MDEEDLRFTAADLRAACHAADLQIGDDEISAMMALTGGWPTALGFALRSSARSSDLVKIAEMTRDMAYSYFADQIYRTLDDEERALLESGALLDEFDADVLVAAGFDRARPMLEDLRRRVAFLSEERPGIYRCQDLFRTFVLHRVDRDGAAATAERRARLAAGLERCGRIAETLRMEVAGDRTERVLALLERHGLDLLAKGHRDAVVEGLAALEERVRRENPLVVALRGIVAEGAGNYDEADRLLEAALSRPLPAAERPGIVLRLARLRVNRGEDVGEHVRKLSASDDGSVECCDAIAMMAAASARAQDGDTARRLLARCDASVALIDDEDGRARILQRTGIAHLELGNVPAAVLALKAAQEIASERSLWSIATRASLGLSHLALFADGDTLSALRYAKQAATAAARAGEMRSVENAAAFELSISVRRGDMSRVIDLEREISQSMGQAASMRYVVSSRGTRAIWDGRFSDAHRLLGAIVGSQNNVADQLMAYGLYALSLSLDEESSRSSEAVSKVRDLLEKAPANSIGAVFFDFGRLFAALAETFAGRHTSAKKLLKRISTSGRIATSYAYETVVAVERAHRANGCVGESFTDYLALIDVAGFGGYSKCLAAVNDYHNLRHSQEPRVRLTESERRILALLASGLAPKEIASELDRSVLTVQTHIQNIIAKFDCHGRSEAIALAQRQRLI
ncbi:MAG: LuxR C-terminal-related transcriptional regulator [Vulcanimicrobiaceae bacterium]